MIEPWVTESGTHGHLGFVGWVTGKTSSLQNKKLSWCWQTARWI